jgi:excisionase family DNA binding protein
MQRLLTTRQVAEILGITPLSVQRMRVAGHLRGVKIGRLVRFEESDVKTFVKRRKEQTK